ncbi:MAG: VWA domain-containing protein [Bacteroidota bacterium]
MLAIGLCFAFDTSASGRGKAAYRNYYLGNYYFSEGLAKKAEPYFRRAFDAVPQQLTFALGYALSLSDQGSSKEAIAVLQLARKGLSSTQPDASARRVVYHYVAAIVRTQAGDYAEAQRSIRKAIVQQEALDKYAHQRLAGMYNLAGYLAVMMQEAPKSHAGLGPHVHVKRQALQHAYPYFFQALSLDTSRIDSEQNLNIIADTLGQPKEVRAVVRPYRPQLNRQRELVNYYPHLPRKMESLVPFSQYDEVLFLVDISGSMVMEQVACAATDRFTIMKEAAQLLVDYLPDSTRVGLATIGGDCSTDPSWWMRIDSIDQQQLKWELKYLNSNGTTPLLTTLLKTPTLFSENPTRKKSIFFISDGENICKVPGVDICDWASQLPAQHIALNVLTFLDRNLSNSGAFAEYACLSERSGGQVRYLDPLACTIDDFSFDLVDQIQFFLPPLERVNCWGEPSTPLWAIFSEK